MSSQKPKPEHLAWAAGGVLVGAWWVKNRHDEARKSRAERDDPEGVENVCNAIGPILDDWSPEGFDSEDEYVEDLFEYLVDRIDDDFDLEMSPDTREGTPDILIADLLALEVKRDLSKAERDRLAGRPAGYSREWVTWIVLVDTPNSRVGAVEKLLADKDLSHILVFAFS